MEIPREFQISFRHSIILRTLIAFSLIITFNLLSMLAGMYLSDSIRGDAEAINRAGSMRMQSFRLALILSHPDSISREAGTDPVQQYIQHFNETIHSFASLQVVRSNNKLNASYSMLLERWQDLLLPLVEQNPPQRRSYMAEVPAFVESLDIFVNQLQLASEKKLSYIIGLQIFSLFFTVLLAFFVITSSHNNLVTPLLKIVSRAKAIGKGDFNASVNIKSRNELGLLGETLDMMADELSELYASLENKVDIKTRELKQSNASLKLLFNTARQLYKTTDDPIPVLGSLLDPILQTLGSQEVSLCLFALSEGSEQKAHTVLSTRPHSRPLHCQYPDCSQCASSSGQGAPPPAADGFHRFELKAENTIFGHLQVRMPDNQPLAHWQEQLLTALADFFAVALNLNSMGQRQARIALMEERAVIARELHDSLAQALSYQKIQLALLKKQLLGKHSPETLQNTFNDLQAGLSAAYRHLRELLSTFRLKLNQPGLAASIEATIQDLSRHTATQIELDYRIEHCPLTPNEELHCLQIIREALSNVIKHANASLCHIRLYQDSEGLAHIQVEDDGVGIDLSINRSGHYGIAILKERSQTLSGQLEIRPLQPGTCIHVRFLPAYLYNQPNRDQHS